MIYGVIAIGGFTRLTDSGLSMVDWNPISGILPPFTESDWNAEFEHYQQFPEYQTVNIDMSLDEFKRIFWVEYAHRVAGRIVAVTFLFPFLYFQFRGYFTGAMSRRLIAVFLLGGMQGLLGWYMVKSGLVDDPSVSQYRLTAHLSLAVFLYAYILWLAAGLLCDKPQGQQVGSSKGLMKGVIFCIALVVIMQVSGGFMAGTHAGFILNTYPLMNGEWIPDMLFSLTPFWVNFFENVIAIQFLHRWIAFVAVVAIIIVWTRRFSMAQSPLRVVLDIAMIVAIGQFLLGIATLLSRVHLPIALIHQSGFLLLLSTLVILLRLVANQSGVDMQNEANTIRQP